MSVYYDGNGDGVQDGPENYAEGIAVALSGPGAPMNGTTDINGSYTFTGVPVGDYNVLITPPDGYNCVFDGSVSVVSDTDNLGTIFPLEADKRPNESPPAHRCQDLDLLLDMYSQWSSFSMSRVRNSRVI